MRTFSLAGVVVVVALSLSPNRAKSDPPSEDALRAKVRELEDRLARVEKQLLTPAPESIPFGELTVNLKEERLQRYLRIKIALQVDETSYKETSALVTKKKAEMRNWAITFLSDKSLKDVSGSKGVEGLQEALKKAFGEILAPGAKKNPIKNVLFEEYVVQ